MLCAPHLEGGGEDNNAFVVEVSGRELLVAEKNNRWLAVGASCGFSRLSCGYVGQSDGYTDLAKHHKMEFEFDEAKNGNVALTGELNLSNTREFTVGVAFGETLSSAVSALFQSLGHSYKERRQVFIQQWEAAKNGRKPLEKSSGDKGRLFESSYNLLLTHEDKLYQGAFVASLTIPWGEARNDKRGRAAITWFGHATWWRARWDCWRPAIRSAPLRALIYLAARQEEDGSFPQNFWVDGEAFWNGMQLDEVAFPVLLAWRLHQFQLLGQFDPRVMVKRAVAFLLHSGPVTGEERWEEASGYSPSTLAAIISAFICAASFARAEQDRHSGLPGELCRFSPRASGGVDGDNRRVAGSWSVSLLCAPEPGQARRSRGSRRRQRSGTQADQPTSRLASLLSGSRHRRCGFSAAGALWSSCRGRSFDRR